MISSILKSIYSLNILKLVQRKIMKLIKTMKLLDQSIKRVQTIITRKKNDSFIYNKYCCSIRQYGNMTVFCKSRLTAFSIN
jgi:hypothetical protein